MHLPYEHVSLREGLRRGRSHLLFLAGLAIVMAIIVALDGIAPSPQQRAVPAPPTLSPATVRAQGRSAEPLATGTDTFAARVARDSTAPAPTPVLP